MTDELDALAEKWEGAEADEQKAEAAESEEPIIQAPSDEAGELAKFTIDTLSDIARLFEPRLDLKEQGEQAREDCAPVVEKYELHTGGPGVFRWRPEMKAGLFLGRYIKTILVQLRILKEHDERAKNGNQRENGATEPAHPVPGAERVWQEPDATAAGGDTEARAAD